LFLKGEGKMLQSVKFFLMISMDECSVFFSGIRCANVVREVDVGVALCDCCGL
jgi:hypothetical protein